MSREDYKNNSDQKVNTAVVVATERAKTEKENEFVQREKNPLREYTGSEALGSITFKYPKTWSGYLVEDDTKSSLLMHPGLVSGNEKAIYALRVEVESSQYDKVMRNYESDVKSGIVKATAFRLNKLQEVAGTRLDGEIANGIQGSMIVLPLRDKTLKISTESKDFSSDFESIILPNLTFIP